MGGGWTLVWEKCCGSNSAQSLETGTYYLDLADPADSLRQTCVGHADHTNPIRENPLKDLDHTDPSMANMRGRVGCSDTVECVLKRNTIFRAHCAAQILMQDTRDAFDDREAEKMSLKGWGSLTQIVGISRFFLCFFFCVFVFACLIWTWVCRSGCGSTFPKISFG